MSDFYSIYEILGQRSAESFKSLLFENKIYAFIEKSDGFLYVVKILEKDKKRSKKILKKFLKQR